MLLHLNMRTPPAESNLQPQEFSEVLVSPVFNDRIREISRFTIGFFQEGGMAVYKSGGGYYLLPCANT